MTNGSQQPLFIKEEIPPQSKKSNNGPRIGLGIVIVVFLIAILWIVYVAMEIDKRTEKAQIEFVLDTFMEHMIARDLESAYALFSPRAQQQFALSYLQDMRASYISHSLFTGYQSLSVQKLDFTSVANTGADILQGTDVIASGVISYEGGYTGGFTVEMEKVNDLWRIRNFRMLLAQPH